MTEQKLRLHITPFSEDLAQSILSTYSSLADNITYHTLETFPEHSYGYIELPVMEAEKLKKKLNGSILKGKKLRIESARPQKRKLDGENTKEHGEAPTEVLPSKESKKRRSELQGHELTPERKVRRGWTEPGKTKRDKSLKRGASSSATSKYTEKPECMFRVQLPPNKETDQDSLTKNDKSRYVKGRKKGTVVHEFEKTVIQPSFIRNETGNGHVGPATEYVEGKGWIDHDGNVIEEDSKRQLRKRKRFEDPQAEPGLLHSANPSAIQASSSRVPSSDHGDTKDRNSDEDRLIKPLIVEHSVDMLKVTTEIVEEETSSSGTSLSDASRSSSESLSEPEAEEELDQESETVEAKAHEKPQAGLEAASASNGALHPLEALFKRPNQAASQSNGKRPLAIKTTFSFFESSEEQTMPQTPFTTRDLQLRGLRSAAPTPDTALPTKRFFAESISPISNDGKDDEADLDRPSDTVLPSDASKQEEGESEFAKWFWEHRGENNRAWKRRRREALKEKRQRENRQKGSRIGGG